MKSVKRFLPFILLFSVFIASFGSILFGYNSAVISGALLFISDDFSLSYWQQGFLVSSLVLGAAVGSAVGGIVADRYGRKAGLILTALIFLIGTFTIVYLDSFSSILIGRVIQGLAVGIVSVIVPLYLSEISPVKYRGAIVSVNQLAIVFGVTISYIIDYYFADGGAWRDMFLFGALPALIFLVGLFFIPKSPSFLLSKGNFSLVRKIEKKLGHGKEGKTFKREMDTSCKNSKKCSFKSIFVKENKYPLIVGVGISVFQQITGINIVIYYAPHIFKMSNGFDNNKAILATVMLGVVKFIMTIVAIYFVDKIGRKKLLYIGTIGMGVSMALLGTSFFLPSPGYSGIVSMMLYLSFYSISLGPITWLIISEIFALPIRGRAMGIAALSNWSANYLVTLAFLPIISVCGGSFTFYMLALICFVAFYFVRRKIPETKNKSFEEIQKFWKQQAAADSRK